jgi:hypothetical protein
VTALPFPAREREEESSEGALLYLASGYLQGQRVWALIRRSLREVFEPLDVLVSPAAVPAAPAGLRRAGLPDGLGPGGREGGARERRALMSTTRL